MNSHHASIATIPDAMKERVAGAVVATPLQYLNALELVEALACRQRYLVIQEAFYRRSDFADLPGFSDWQRVDVIPADRPTPRSGRYARFVIDLVADFVAHRRVGRVFNDWPVLDQAIIGNPHEVLQQDFASRSGAGDLLICEDGTSSAVFDPSVESRSRRLRRRVLGVRDDLLDHVWWYTAYPQGRRSQRLLLNTYAFLRSQLSQRCATSREDSEIWFLGQPLVEFGVMSAVAYADVIRSIARDVYPGRRLRYLPHPREWPDCLARLEADTGVTLARRSGPVEIELIRCARPPARVGMLYSSAFQTCHTIFAGAIPFDVFEPGAWELAPDNGETRIMRDCYAYFREHVRPPHHFFHQDASLGWARLEVGQENLTEGG
ncbi:hypothetical protein KGQ90_03705 [Modicisalibacter tunisiensis]|uniref:hypothetical protein n=1 Tax=Modicisalibacter tunisiensis TaxID=390637 RepID=UPI001CCC1C21|nr:hypothetical protein [Modicisalibacter tunisiensis]MBZ9538049.1 hypothetical protein [Modicisalibacter tunisiensis]